MASLSAVSQIAASAVTSNLAAQGGTTSAVGVDPSGATVAGMDQTGIQAAFSIGALKLALGQEASQGNQLAQMMGLGNAIDTTA
jgi:hypothetical protein